MFPKKSPQILHRFEAGIAQALERLLIQEVPVVEPEHRQHTGLNDDNRQTFFNVGAQSLSGAPRLCCGSFDQALRERRATISNNIGHRDFDSNRAQYF